MRRRPSLNRAAVHPMEETPPIDEFGRLEVAPPGLMDHLWACGWRHFGATFFRYNRTVDADGRASAIMPLRIPLATFALSKSQRRTLGRNRDLQVAVLPAVVDDEREALFHKHRIRFTSNVPDSLRDFMASPEPHHRPCRCVAVELRLDGRLLAVSYLDVDQISVSSVYAIFDPAESRRGLGILTLLEEIRWARAQGKRWLYPGYCTEEPGAYDYKKSFRPIERFDWKENWLRVV